MTDSIEWGPEIEVNGVRPVWLRDEDVGLFENTKGEWIGGIHKCLSAWEWGVSEDICCPIAIRLRADHPYYVKQVTNIPTADLIAELRTRTDLPEGVVLPEPEPDWEAWENASEVALDVYFRADEPTPVQNMTRALIAARPYMPKE